jgi:ABC-type proline/glycine betaine transport system permease subunit
MASAPSSVPRIALGIGVAILLGVPLLAYVWETANRLVAGHFDLVRFLITIPAAALLILLWRVLARRIEAWHGERVGTARTPEAP